MAVTHKISKNPPYFPSGYTDALHLLRKAGDGKLRVENLHPSIVVTFEATM